MDNKYLIIHDFFHAVHQHCDASAFDIPSILKINHTYALFYLEFVFDSMCDIGGLTYHNTVEFHLKGVKVLVTNNRKMKKCDTVYSAYMQRCVC